MNDEFYIGWEDRAPERIGRNVRRLVVSVLAVVVLLAAGFAALQRTIGRSAFEWGVVKTFSGTLQSQPYPHLLVPRPGSAGDQLAFSSYYLVAPFKHGLSPEAVAALDHQAVTLEGTLIYRGNQTMIEVRPETLRKSGNPDLAAVKSPEPAQLGRQTLVGEIVDSKCYLGVMNPGQLTPHRACAIRCISGGIPPVLLVRQTDGPPLYFLLVSEDGAPVNRDVLELVAEPVEVTGEVVRQGSLLVLRANPSTYRRVSAR